MDAKWKEPDTDCPAGVTIGRFAYDVVCVDKRQWDAMNTILDALLDGPAQPTVELLGDKAYDAFAEWYAQRKE